ncbi:protein TIC 100 [Physcomitrium patens]|uniref:Uncharacterized protein n=1 Tax=Physcomitrium patens TaxID=3218 RepID=A9TKY9_PHYPA|nr:protein TIC 100-like [Physcomitrium patens]PNR40486.1 hypothetical protein PHYPA_017888 [Physcomitrium patens]|eukprot:XP_024394868.1 protein TIC 100-like [Physcomitrella patens]
MASSTNPDDEFLFPDDDDEPQPDTTRSSAASSPVIPNFRGKLPEPEVPDSKGPLKVEWASDDESEEDEDEEDEEDVEEEGMGESSEVGVDGQEPSSSSKRRMRKRKEKEAEEEEDEVLEEEDEWNFPTDRENWTEEDLEEEWADPTSADDTVGRDPELAEDDEELIAKLEKDGRAPLRRPYYVPYRKAYPSIPEDHPDIDSPEAVVEELERMEEFLVWASYIFEDGSSYEGTVWDDLAHGKGVYTTPMELCKYEGEWFQNLMQGHGVIEVDIPVANPPPGSELERKMKAEGKILTTDFLSPEDKEWLRMDLEDALADNPEAVDTNPFEDDDLWVKYFGEKPEKGHYKYAGQWKHSRMHGCGVYELNGRQTWGKFYFGEMLPDEEECDDKLSAMHASLAEVAAAKARMFVNKPDGMVREMKGPFSDPQHPYMYEEEDMWMAPGFINQFYPVPEVWERYVKEVDSEQEMWLNSFTKAPLRIPMPSELEYLWEKDEEFLVLTGPSGDSGNSETDGAEVLYHVPTGQIINWAEDAEGKLRFFIQPMVEDGSVEPDLAIPLPTGFKHFYGEKDSPDDDYESGDGDGEEGGKLLSQDEKLEKEWKEREEERKRRWAEEDAERELEWAEREKELELELELKNLDAQLDETVDEAEMLLKLEDLYGATESGKEEDRVDAEGRKEEASLEEESTSRDSVKDDEEVDDEDQDDDEDPKPRSFGKVAMASPQGGNSGSSGNTSFPTAFASISLATQTTMKQVLGLVVKNSRKTWLADLLSPKSVATPTINSTASPMQLQPDSMVFSPLKEVSVNIRSTRPLSKLTATARPQMQPKTRIIPRPRSSSCRIIATEQWSTPSIEVLSLCLPVEV